MELPGHFADFIKAIKTTPDQAAEMHKEQTALRERLQNDERLGPSVHSTFLHGSHRRATANKPPPQQKSDIDVVVVTAYDLKRVTATQALESFVPFLEKHYKGKYKSQGRSYGITFEHVKVDLVPTAMPPERELEILKSKAVTSFETPEDAQDWRLNKFWVPKSERIDTKALGLFKRSAKEEEWEPGTLFIPDRDAKEWQQTNPLRQMHWTWGKNSRCSGFFVHVARSIKWWRCSQKPNPKYPKSYPLENMIGDSCPDGIRSVAQGVTLALEDVAERYAEDARLNRVPFIGDHGIPDNNVLARVSGADFAAFHRHVQEAAKQARHALDLKDNEESAAAWVRLFGHEFPGPKEKDPAGGFTPRTAPSIITGGRFG